MCDEKWSTLHNFDKTKQKRKKHSQTEFRLDPRTLLIVFLALSTIGMLAIMMMKMPSMVAG